MKVVVALLHHLELGSPPSFRKRDASVINCDRGNTRQGAVRSADGQAEISCVSAACWRRGALTGLDAFFLGESVSSSFRNARLR